MARDIAEIGRQEVEAHRRFRIGMTATDPEYKIVDDALNKEFVVDVFLGAVFDEGSTDNLLRNVPIAEMARAHVTEQHTPVLLEWAKQGHFTVVGRSKKMPAGYSIGDVIEPTYNRVLHNYADLRLLFIPDLDWTRGPLQADPSEALQEGPSDPLQTLIAHDAFGHQVGGPGVTNPPQAIQDLLSPKAMTKTTERHLVVKRASLGPKGDAGAMTWGTSTLNPTICTIVATTT